MALCSACGRCVDRFNMRHELEKPEDLYSDEAFFYDLNCMCLRCSTLDDWYADMQLRHPNVAIGAMQSQVATNNQQFEFDDVFDLDEVDIGEPLLSQVSFSSFSSLVEVGVDQDPGNNQQLEVFFDQEEVEFGAPLSSQVSFVSFSPQAEVVPDQDATYNQLFESEVTFDLNDIDFEGPSTSLLSFSSFDPQADIELDQATENQEPEIEKETNQEQEEHVEEKSEIFVNIENDNE